MAKIERPLIMFIGRRSILLVIAVAAILVVAGLFALAAQKEEVPGSPEKNSLPVNARLFNNESIKPSPDIVFESEIIQPEGKGQSYFVNYRLQRENVRQENKTMLAALLNSPQEGTRRQAQEKWLELSNKIEKEGELENLLKIKGFQDAIANVSPDSVSIVIYAPALRQEEVKIIRDAAEQVTKIKGDQIWISLRY